MLLRKPTSLFTLFLVFLFVVESLQLKTSHGKNAKRRSRSPQDETEPAEGAEATGDDPPAGEAGEAGAGETTETPTPETGGPGLTPTADPITNIIPGTDGGPPITDIQDPDKRAAAELQSKILAIHNNDPRDAMQLASKVLTKVFERYQKKRGEELPVTMILEKAADIPGRTALFLLRILSKMDMNNDYKINKEEFASFFSGPAAHSDKLIEMMFMLHDINGNGALSIYDYLWNEVLSLGINYNLNDMWRSATQKLAEVDISDDRMVDVGEFSNFFIFQVNKAIALQRVNANKIPANGTAEASTTEAPAP